MLRHFANVLRDEHSLRSSQQVDIYEQVDMFLCILAHGKEYRQVNTLFNHLLQIICHYVKEVLRVIVSLSARLIRPSQNYNKGLSPHRPDLQKHPLFEDCIGAIDRTHVRVVLPRNERQTRNTHDARLLARVIHSPDIHLLLPDPGKYYLVDLEFAHRPGYMAPYKGSDILYHFQQFRDEHMGWRRRFHNDREKFNFRHSSCRNVIECAFGVVDEAFTSAEEDEDAAEVELLNAGDEMRAKMNASDLQRSQ
ncbi:uncharacterized protein LOC111386624 [Olea europaea var. sylvestris]|uniref:uncharacterized protein LOC111386624 n=1 Tax=Olea europaea var. sylvestris TaxID=158386 RepID=UPI000C1D8BCA|nr:uncharacterized protein LOC111386624 [Olea europaea var. sylvestris]